MKEVRNYETTVASFFTLVPFLLYSRLQLLIAAQKAKRYVERVMVTGVLS